MIFSKKPAKKELSKSAMEGEKDIKICVTLKLDVAGGYNEPTVANVDVTKMLKSNSDTPVREILAEVADLLGSSTDEFSSLIAESRHLSDGLHAAERAEKEARD